MLSENINCETKVFQEENNKPNKPKKIKQYSSSEDGLSNAEKNAKLFKKKQDNAILKLIWVYVICIIFMIIEIIGAI